MIRDFSGTNIVKFGLKRDVRNKSIAALFRIGSEIHDSIKANNHLGGFSEHIERINGRRNGKKWFSVVVYKRLKTESMTPKLKK